jgi:hypothetical protein
MVAEFDCCCGDIECFSPPLSGIAEVRKSRLAKLVSQHASAQAPERWSKIPRTSATPRLGMTTAASRRARSRHARTSSGGGACRPAGSHSLLLAVLIIALVLSRDVGPATVLNRLQHHAEPIALSPGRWITAAWLVAPRRRRW